MRRPRHRLAARQLVGAEPAELPIGIVTALLGAPVFIIGLLARNRAREAL